MGLGYDFGVAETMREEMRIEPSTPGGVHCISF
jgi:hypothetical protein